MSVRTSVAAILDQHVSLELECIDRMYCNVYIPQLQHDGGIVSFFRRHRGMPIVTGALMGQMSAAFSEAIGRFVREHGVELRSFRRAERKDDVAHEYLARNDGEEGILFLGKAQERTAVFRTERRRDPKTGRPAPWLVRSSAMVTHYYWYAVDRDFGPFFFKFASYFPYTAKLCFNGHEYLKRQATRAGIAFQALDNGIASTADPAGLQAIADGLSAERIERFARKWLALLPQPFTAVDQDAGYHYQLSILQAEFSLTQVLDRPATGRAFFEEVIRENLDLGRPDQAALIFDRRLIRSGHRPTPGRFRTRVITSGVIPSLHLEYKSSRIKQYHKEGQALRTETTVNDTRDFEIRKGLHNLAALRRVGFQANRRLLHVERISHDCAIGEDAFARLTHPVEVRGQRAAGLRFGEPRVQALLQALLPFRLLPTGFSAAELRAALAPLLGIAPGALSQGRMSYELRRLRLHGIIERIPKKHRYRVTDPGLRSTLFLVRSHARLLRPGLAQVLPDARFVDQPLRSQFDKLIASVDRLIAETHLAA